MKKNLIKNIRAVSYPIQSIMAFSIVAVIIAFYFIGIHGTFVSHEGSNVDISAKAIDVAERLLSDPGQTSGGSMEWEMDPANLSVLGLNAKRIFFYHGFNYDVPSHLYGSSSTDASDRYNIPLIAGVRIVCFLSGTKIEMADGTTKNIEDIQVGDKVKSFDTRSKTWRVGTVTKVFHHSPEEMGDYYLVINHELKVTPNHPIWVNGKWIHAGELKIGDKFGDNIIYSTERIYRKVPTYNLEVEPYHTYAVAWGKGISIVHNKVIKYEPYNDTAIPIDSYSIHYSSPSWSMYRYDINGIAVYEIKENRDFPYAVLDERKIGNLSNIDYDKAKKTLDLGKKYDFNITITNNTGDILLTYGKEYNQKNIVSICTRNVLIRHTVFDGDQQTYIFEPAELIVRIFF